VRPAIGRVLINVDTTTGAMYNSGNLRDLALEFLDKPNQPNALAPLHGLPERERLRLQQFISGIKVTTPYRTHDPDKKRTVKQLTRESARNRTFDVGDGQTMTIEEYFLQKWNIPLRFPDAICVEVCTMSVLSFSPSDET
jgi:eukaryotic translation initiation factor 2C